MNFVQKLPARIDSTQSTLELVWQAAEVEIASLKARLTPRLDFVAAFQTVRETLERLPISQSEFALATLRLNNAQTYCGQNEFGAAKIELNLLYGMVFREAECVRMRQPMKSRC